MTGLATSSDELLVQIDKAIRGKTRDAWERTDAIREVLNQYRGGQYNDMIVGLAEKTTDLKKRGRQIQTSVLAWMLDQAIPIITMRKTELPPAKRNSYGIEFSTDYYDRTKFHFSAEHWLQELIYKYYEEVVNWGRDWTADEIVADWLKMRYDELIEDDDWIEDDATNLIPMIQDIKESGGNAPPRVYE